MVAVDVALGFYFPRITDAGKSCGLGLIAILDSFSSRVQREQACLV